MSSILHELAVCAGTVFVGELGDKTQLLSLLLACRYRRALPIIAGILVATLANHALAAAGGLWLRELLTPGWRRWLLGLSFIATGLWALKPDTLDDRDVHGGSSRSVFIVTVIAFFLAEIGDKTQVATVLLAARFDGVVTVVAGTTLGMLLADVPVVLFGERLMPRRSLIWARYIAAAIFAALGIAVLLR